MIFSINKLKKKLHPATCYKRRFPNNLKKEDLDLFKIDLERKLPDLFSYEYKNICINKDEYLWKGLKFLDYSFFRMPLRRKEKLSNIKFLIKSFFIKKNKINNGLWLIDNWSSGYFHWFGDVLQKYYSIKDKNYKLVLPFRYSTIEFITESAKYLEIQLCFLEENEIVKCKNLIVIPTSFISGNYYESIIKALKKSFNIKKIENSNRNIIYISRSDTQRRKVVNEKEIIKIINNINGKIVRLENFNWLEQLYLFSNCKLIISPHGGGLTNMIFMNSNSKVLELRHPKSYIQNMFFSMASALEIDYYYIKCSSNSMDSHTGDISVPVEKLKSSLKQILKTNF